VRKLALCGLLVAIMLTVGGCGYVVCKAIGNYNCEGSLTDVLIP